MAGLLQRSGLPTYNASSIGGNPGYASNLYNLHAVKQQLNDKGTFIGSVLIDINGQTRPLAPSTVVDIGADEFYPPAHDIGVTKFASDFCTNSQPVSATVTNFAAATINNFTVNWTLNGQIQSPANVTGATLASGNTMNVTLNPSFNFVNGTTYNFRFWTSKPNSVTDSVP